MKLWEIKDSKAIKFYKKILKYLDSDSAESEIFGLGRSLVNIKYILVHFKADLIFFLYNLFKVNSKCFFCVSKFI